MALKKSVRGKSTSNGKRSAGGRSGAKSSARSTISSPARHDADSSDELVAKMEATEALAAAMPFNANKPAEYGKATLDPQPGATVPNADARATGSTLTESVTSA